jgi:hypothetical protein
VHPVKRAPFRTVVGALSALAVAAGSLAWAAGGATETAPVGEGRIGQQSKFPSWTGPIGWLEDGSIRLQVGDDVWLSGETGRKETPEFFHYQFGLPGQPPDRRWREEEVLPIYHARWDHDAIRYTQIVLISRIEPGEVMLGDRLPDDAVILVQLTGESLATSYTDATAALKVDVDGQPLELSLERGLARAEVSDLSLILGAVDVPTEGIEGSRGPELRFRGHMPPGTSGSMTIKIPMGPVREAERLERLLDLEFDDEFRRVKRFWKSGKAVDASSGGLVLIAEPEL